MTLPTFTLTTAAASGTYPFSLGVGLKKGDATAIACNLTNYQVAIKRTWNDGSIKHAIISGRAALTSGVPRTVTISSGAAQTGTALTASSIATAAPTASVQCGAFGTVSLAGLLATPFRTWVSGHEMVEAHYRGAVGGGTLLDVWFHVRLFADGRMWVRACVENGYLDNGVGAVPGNADRSYVPTVIIGGVTVYDNGGGTLVHRAAAAWTAEGWIGGDPLVTPLHDVANLRAIKLVPNYGYTTPSSSALNALDQTYTPMDRGPHVADMGATGFANAIGLLPLWDALYCTSGDARARAAVTVGSSSLRSYPIGYARGFTSKQVIKPTAFTNWNPGGPGAGGTDTLGNATLTWEYNHHPSAGYLEYLLSGDYWAYETMLMQAAICYLCVDSGQHGTSVNRILRRQVRGTGWAMRTIGQLCAIAPDTEIQAGEIVADYRTLLENNYATHKTTIDAAGTMVWSGSPYQYSYGEWAGTGSVASWMMDFWVQSNGHISDLEPLASTTNLHAVRDWMYRWVVGRMGLSGVSSEFDFTRAGQYGIVVATSNLGTTWQQTWGAVHTATFGSANTVATNTLQGSSAGAPSGAATGYWGNLIPALAYAVEHGASGAAAAWTRLTGASNYSAVTGSGFDDIPIFGVAPRSGLTATRTATYNIASATTAYIGRAAPAPEPGDLPYTLPDEGEVVNIHLNSLSSVNPCPGDACWYSENDKMNGWAVNWCGAIYAPDYGTHGAWVTRGGGHLGYSGIELHIFDIGTGMWSVIAATPATDAWLSSLDATWGDYDNGAGGYIVPADHTYNNMLYVGPADGGGAQGSMLIMCSTYGGFEGYRPHLVDLATGVYSRFTTGTYTPAMAFGPYGGGFVDTNRRIAWGMAGIENNTQCKIDLTATPKVIVPVSSFYVGGIYFVTAFAAEADMALSAWSKGGEPNVNLALYDCSSGTPVIVTLTLAADLPKFALNAYSLAWHPGTKKFYLYGGVGESTIHTLTPPALYANWTTQNWTWGTETPTGAAFANVLEVKPAASGAHPFNKMLYHPPTNCLMWSNGLCVRESPDTVSRDGAFQLYRPIGAEVI